MDIHRQVTGTAYGKSIYPEYDAADLGFEEYWYPAMFGRQLRRRPKAVTLCGRPLVLVRDGGRVYALEDRCAHRGIPLSMGKREFPGTLTCCYHGWTYDLGSGDLLAALTDGADSPICASPAVRVRSYPARERAGIVWVYIGNQEPPPVEEHIPDELLRPGTTTVGRITQRVGDWRHAAENGFDEGHAKYLHRSSRWTFLRYLPAWSTVKIQLSQDGKWLGRVVTAFGFRTEYPGLGKWPAKPPFWKLVSGRTGTARIGIRLPCLLWVEYVGHWWTHFEWYVPTVVGRYRYFQFIVNTRPGAAQRARLWLWYWLYLRWMFHLGLFNQDDRMVRRMQTPPEQLYRPDVSIVGWRRYCMQAARGRPGEMGELDSDAPEVAATPGEGA